MWTAVHSSTKRDVWGLRTADAAEMSHACPIENCIRPAKDGQLMCWPHWRRVPRILNRVVFETYRNLRADPEAYRRARDEAIRIVNLKERGWEYDL